MPLNSAAEEKLVGLCEVRASLVYILSSSHSCTVGPCLKGEEGGGREQWRMFIILTLGRLTVSWRPAWAT